MIDPRSIPVRFSHLRAMSQSPLHYHHAIQHVKSEPTPAMRFGSLVHALVLGGEFCAYHGERRGNAWRDFKAEHEGELIVTPDEVERAGHVAGAVGANPHAKLMLKGDHEVEIPWTFNGRTCLSHVDSIGAEWITELKTSQTVEPYRFTRHATAMGYHAQLAFYEYAVAGRPIQKLGIVAVETKPPFAVQCFELTRQAIEAGHKLWRSWFEMLQVCEASNIWPAYSQTVLPFDVDAAPEYVWPSEGGESDQ